ncbi:hypothetical protein [Actinoplanes sp. NPDC026623]|uniref:RCC1 domain-containing protein n=1 Tax=Actinoplanes sp. NPDC026623 TaxID=3155610 RepID=UPI0033E96C02
MLKRITSRIGALAMLAVAVTAMPAEAQQGDAVRQLTAGGRHTCEISGATAWCWGYGGHGELGNGSVADQWTAVPVRAPRGVVFTQLTAGDSHTCGIGGARAYCWGEGADGKLGDGGTTDRAAPVPVRAPRGVVFTQLAAGTNHTCGISGAGTWCWGDNADGELGNGGNDDLDHPAPVRVRTPQGVVFTRLTAGEGHTCGISAAGTYCWGQGILGTLGDGGSDDRWTPVRVRTPQGVRLTQLAAGSAHTCGAGRVRAYCWGYNNRGQLGDGDTTGQAAPVPVRAPQGVVFTQLAAGSAHTCGAGRAGTYCWGYGDEGQLGNGGTADHLAPAPVRAPRGVVFTQLAAGSYHTCGVSGARTYCWGDGDYGMLGNAGAASRTTPVQVVFGQASRRR